MQGKPSFESQLKDPTCALAIDFSEASDVLIIAFGGHIGGLNIPPFEFFKTTQGLPCKKIFMRDVRLCCYHKGAPNMGSSIEDIATELKKLIKDSGAKRVITLGTSSGGYAAILFGLLLQLDEAHGFCPKTYINPIRRIWHRNRMILKLTLNLALSPKPQRKYYDLKKVLNKTTHPLKIHLHYGLKYPKGVHHAAHISHDPRVTLHPYDYEKHGIARHLRDQDLLAPLLQEIILAKAPTSP